MADEQERLRAKLKQAEAQLKKLREDTLRRAGRDESAHEPLARDLIKLYLSLIHI